MPRLLPLRLPRVCVAIIAPTAAEMFEKADAMVRDNPFIELRLDYLRQPASAFQRIRRFLDYHPQALMIATCRRAVNGGKFRGSVTAQVQALLKAASCGSQFLDVELETAAALKSKDLDRLRTAAAVILSFHDFRATRKLDETFQKMTALPADYYKIVGSAKSLSDNVTMMKFLERQTARYSVVGLCMGEQGTISRILCLRAGSAFTFASAAEGEETAPGQIAARTLRETYRIDQVDAATKVYGVAGDPVTHSLSPLMMNTAFRRENINGVYVALHATKLSDLLTCVREIPLHGLSITMPYKEEIIEHLDNTDAVTEKIGACNTVIRTPDGKLYGYNTDVAGVVRPLEQRLHLSGTRVLVMGAGGGARAAVFGLKERGAEVFIVNRTASVGQKLARKAHAKFLNRTQVRGLQFDVIVNATPVGMNGKLTPLGEKELNARILFEMVYTPAETKLVKLARAKGMQVITGAEMFVQQGARQFEIWTGKPAPAEDMYRVVTTALQARAANGGKKHVAMAAP
jgi:3-dehydroquinate dehydratase/shikimate dehydrogenase